jgi:hypothetical protein
VVEGSSPSLGDLFFLLDFGTVAVQQSTQVRDKLPDMLHSTSRLLLGGFAVTRRSITSGRNFKILGVQQIAIGALDKKVLSDFWVGKLGIEKVSDYRSEVSLLSDNCQLV